MKAAVIIISILLISACESGSGSGLTEQGRPIEESIVVVDEENDGSNGDVVESGIQPHLSSIQEHVFTPLCSTCHGGANPAAGQNLSSIESSIASLINIDASNPRFKRVLPGSALKSYLYLKITGDVQAGTRMPLGQPALPEETINAIKTWIQQGALVPQNKYIPAIVSRVSQHEGNDQVVALQGNTEEVSSVDYKWQKEGNLVVVFWFNQTMNFDGLTLEQLLVTATDAEEITARNSWFLGSENMSLNIINDHVLQLNLSQLSSDITRLNIQLNNSKISTLVTQLGQTLDGDKDGNSGGVFTYEITL